MGEHKEGAHHGTTVHIDEGFRRWYEACPCCLEAAYPEVKQVLDQEEGQPQGKQPS